MQRRRHHEVGGMSGEMQLISRAGKTFYFATLWLQKQARYDAALAYNFCRAVDDIADSAVSQPDRDAQLEEIARAVQVGDLHHTLVRPLAPLLRRYPTIVEPLSALVYACKDDTDSLVIRSEDELRRYAFGVAGNVGLVMYPILGGYRAEGWVYAAELGIAMQYTNIARDILEDLSRRRIYIPRAWLGTYDMNQLLKGPSESEDIVVKAVRRLLLLADETYARGLSGLTYLAPENQFAIQVAARCYAAIGERVIQNGRLGRERAVVPLTRKVLLACSIGLFGQQKLIRPVSACKL
jgi:phytoene synthase